MDQIKQERWTVLPMGLLTEGEFVEIVAIGEREVTGRRECDCRAEDMGLRVGNRVEMLANGKGPVLVKVDESRIAVARGIAMRIVVRRP